MKTMSTFKVIEQGVMSRSQMSKCRGGDLFCAGTEYRNTVCGLKGEHLATCPSFYQSCNTTNQQVVSCSVKPYGYSGAPGPAGCTELQDFNNPDRVLAP